jgi:hypothetical protein
MGTVVATQRPLETLLCHVAQPANPFISRPPGMFVLLVDQTKAALLAANTRGLYLPGMEGKIAYVSFHDCLKFSQNSERRWAQRGVRAAVDAGTPLGGNYSIGQHSWPHETGIITAPPAPVDLPFCPIPVCCADPVKFDIKELREALKLVDSMEAYRVWHEINCNGQIDRRTPCMPIALTLSVSPVILSLWDASVHANGSVSESPVFLTLRELPGVPMLSSTNPAPTVQWKKVGLLAYDSWLHVYSPETELECIIHSSLTTPAPGTPP